MLFVNFTNKLESLVAIVVIPVAVPGSKLPAVFTVTSIVRLSRVPVNVIKRREIRPLKLGVERVLAQTDPIRRPRSVYVC